LKIKKGGNPNIGNIRVNLKDEHIQDVYVSVHRLRKAKITDVYKYLKEKDKTISIRTIQRCIAADPRIRQDGWYYSINDESRFEKRYITPKIFGGWLYDEFMHNFLVQGPSFSEMRLFSDNKLVELLESRLKEMRDRFGIFMIFVFLEALKPFKDKSMTQRDRNDLVDYWAMNALPLETMFLNFRMTLHNFQSTLHPKKGSNLHPNLEDKSRSEMAERLIEKVQTIMKKNYPEMYNELLGIVERLDWQTLEDEDGKRLLVRGKSLRSFF
jgi:hypothetical protein